MSRMFNPPHPGEILREEVIKPLDVSVTEAARRLGVSRVALSRILNARAGISAEMAVRLAKALDSDAELWLRMQAATATRYQDLIQGILELVFPLEFSGDGPL